MQIVPLLDVPAQTFSVQLGGQNCTITLRQNITGLYCDLYVNDALVIGGVICLNFNRLVRSLYLGFIGDLAFQDIQGDSDPFSPGLGTRFVLTYLTPTDLGGLG